MKHTFCHHLQITIQDRLQWGIVRKLQTRRAISETNVLVFTLKLMVTHRIEGTTDSFKNHPKPNTFTNTVWGFLVDAKKKTYKD